MLQTCLHEISTMNMPYNYMYKAFLQAIVYREIFALLNPCEFLCEYCGRGCNHVCLKEINQYLIIMVIYKYLKSPCYRPLSAVPSSTDNRRSQQICYGCFKRRCVNRSQSSSSTTIQYFYCPRESKKSKVCCGNRSHPRL